MTGDWLDRGSREERLARFEELGPEPTEGPPEEDWCWRCKKVVEIVDDFDEEIREVGNRVATGHVWQYECGHSMFIRDN